MIDYILMGFLRYAPMTGYDLKQAIDTSTSHFWHAHHSQIYTTLRQMEKDGLVTSQFIQQVGQPNRRLYVLTEAGQRALQDWLEQPLMELPAIKEDLLVRLFFSAARDPHKVIEELRLQRQLHVQKLAVLHHPASVVIPEEHAKIPPEARDPIFWQATVSMGIKFQEMYIQWIDETIRVIEGSAMDPERK
jgi:PadR family transcriptional regulator AphA